MNPPYRFQPRYQRPLVLSDVEPGNGSSEFGKVVFGFLLVSVGLSLGFALGINQGVRVRGG